MYGVLRECDAVESIVICSCTLERTHVVDVGADQAFVAGCIFDGSADGVFLRVGQGGNEQKSCRVGYVDRERCWVFPL